MIRYVQNEKHCKGGFTTSQTSFSQISEVEILERLCEEIQLLARDSRSFEPQYAAVLEYYQNFTKEKIQ